MRRSQVTLLLHDDEVTKAEGECDVLITPLGFFSALRPGCWSCAQGVQAHQGAVSVGSAHLTPLWEGLYPGCPG